MPNPSTVHQDATKQLPVGIWPATGCNLHASSAMITRLIDHHRAARSHMCTLTRAFKELSRFCILLLLLLLLLAWSPPRTVDWVDALSLHCCSCPAAQHCAAMWPCQCAVTGTETGAREETLSL